MNDERLPEIYRELMAAWDSRERGTARARTRIPGKRQKPRGRAQIAGVLALTAHCHELARTLEPRVKSGLTAADYPAVRSLYETMMTVVWLHHEPEAVAAWHEELIRQRRNLANTMAASPTFASLTPHSELPPLETEPTDAARTEARSVQALADRLGLDGSYFIYRLLCEASHPSIAVTQDYLRDSTEHEFALALRPGASHFAEGLLWIVDASLIWAARCVDHLEGNVRRRELRAQAYELEVEADIRFLTRKMAKARSEQRDRVASSLNAARLCGNGQGDSGESQAAAGEMNS